MHEEFLAHLTCPVLRLDGTVPTAQLLPRVLAALREPR
jgi:hypothetical protein